MTTKIATMQQIEAMRPYFFPGTPGKIIRDRIEYEMRQAEINRKANEEQKTLPQYPFTD